MGEFESTVRHCEERSDEAIQENGFTRRHEDPEEHDEDRDTFVPLVSFVSSCELDSSIAAPAFAGSQ
jgi:hypothetical protein